MAAVSLSGAALTAAAEQVADATITGSVGPIALFAVQQGADAVAAQNSVATFMASIKPALTAAAAEALAGNAAGAADLSFLQAEVTMEVLGQELATLRMEKQQAAALFNAVLSAALSAAIKIALTAAIAAI